MFDMNRNGLEKLDISISSASHKNQVNKDQKGLKEGSELYFDPAMNLAALWNKTQVLLGRIFIALKYQFHKYTAGAFAHIKFPWFKLGVAVLVLFIFTQKNIQFSINMKDPSESAWFEEDREIHTESTLAQPVVHLSEEKKNAKAPSLNKLDETAVLAYIKRFKKVARSEMNKFDIPASIKMAQAILESHAGEKASAKHNNNHFGIPMSGADYASAWENWRAHSILLRDDFSELFQAGYSYKKWAKALQAVVYSKDPKYSQKLIHIIERYNLHQLDEERGL